MSSPRGSDVPRELRNVLIPLHDGVTLAANVYLPSTDEPGPALVSFYPYHKDDGIGVAFDDVRRRFAELGYADVLVDMRGSGASGGECWQTWDTAREGADGAAAIEWVARQPWCNGTVGVWGMSYGAIMALAVAARQPDCLRACLPLFGTADIYADWHFPGGMTNALGNAMRETYMLAMDLAPPMYADGDGRWRRVWRDRMDRIGRGDVWALQTPAHPTRDAHWQERMIDCSRVTVPTFLIGGWNDVFPNGTVAAYEALGSAHRKLVMGPWVHVMPHASGREPWDWVVDAGRWWDRWLKDVDTGIETEPAVTLFVQGVDEWRTLDAWPPPGTDRRALYLGTGRSLTERAADEPGSDRYEADLTVGVAGALFEPLGTGLGYPREQSCDDLRSLAYTTDPLEADLVVCGSVEADLLVAIEDGQEADLVVKLTEVDRDGRSHLIATGWSRGAASAAVSATHLRRVALWATAYRVRAASRLRLSVSCADFPRVFPTDGRPVIHLAHGGTTASRVIVPVVPELCTGEGAATMLAPSASAVAPVTIATTPVWQVERDLIADEARVRFGNDMAFPLPQDAHYRIAVEAMAAVSNVRRGSATVLGTARIVARLSGGEVVTVNAESHFTRTTVALTGRVEVDGRVLLDGRWSS